MGPVASSNRPIGPLNGRANAVTLCRVERESIASLKLAFAASFIALCVFAVARLGGVA
jgi:hypothetical protein